MRELLSDINRVSGVRGSLLATRDGMVIVSDVGEGVDAERVAAMAATLTARTRECLQRMGRGQLSQAMLSGTSGKVFVSGGEKGLLIVVAGTEVNVGLVRLEMRAAAERFRKLA